MTTFVGKKVILKNMNGEDVLLNGRGGEVQPYTLAGDQYAVKLLAPFSFFGPKSASTKTAITVYDYQLRLMTRKEEAKWKAEEAMYQKAMEDNEKVRESEECCEECEERSDELRRRVYRMLRVQSRLLLLYDSLRSSRLLLTPRSLVAGHEMTGRDARREEGCGEGPEAGRKRPKGSRAAPHHHRGGDVARGKEAKEDSRRHHIFRQGTRLDRVRKPGQEQGEKRARKDQDLLPLLRDSDP